MEGVGKGRVVPPEQDAGASEVHPMFGFIIAMEGGLMFGNGSVAYSVGNKLVDLDSLLHLPLTVETWTSRGTGVCLPKKQQPLWE